MANNLRLRGSLLNLNPYTSTVGSTSRDFRSERLLTSRIEKMMRKSSSRDSFIV